MTFQGKTRKRNYKEVKAFWEKESKRIGNSPYATIRDHYFRYIEINEIVNYDYKNDFKDYYDLLTKRKDD